MNNNASTYGADSADMPASTLFSAVFQNPDDLDFSAAAGIPEGMGVPAADLQRMMATVDEYGIEVKAPQMEAVDDAYLTSMKHTIFTAWPEAHSSLTLTDRETGLVYTYAERCTYPGVDATVCQ